MKVRIDGQIVERPSYVVRDETYRCNGFGMNMPREEPELGDGEQVLWALGEPVPAIIRLYDPVQE